MPKIDMCTADAPFMQAPDAATSSRIAAAQRMPMPPPPYCSGSAMTTHPPSAIAL